METVGYLILISPLVMAHFIIPPLSHYEAPSTREKYPPSLNFLYDYLPIEIQPGTYENDSIERMKVIKQIEVLMYTQSLPLDSPQVITHMFIHADTNHLSNNLINLILAGYPVYKEFGIVGLTTIFFLGGISSIVNTPLYKKQRDTNVENIVTLRRLPLANIVPKAIISWIDKPIQFVSKIIVDVVVKNNPSKMCGSSGGVCAIVACQSVIVVRDVCKLMLKVYNSIPLTGREKWELLLSSLNTFGSLSYFTNELNMVYGYDSILLSNNNASLLYSINHTAHLQGSLAGIAFTIVFGVALPYVQRSKHFLLPK